MTQIGYAIILLLNSLLSWLMLTDWAFKKLEHLALDYMAITCNGKECYGFVAVHRVNFALGAFHAIMALSLVAARSSKKACTRVQNGYWGPKMLAWLALIVVSFLIPDSFFIFWGNYIALIGAMVFLLIGLVMLTDMAHSWTEYCVRRYSEGSLMWGRLLVGCAMGMYLASLAMTIVMYIFFASKGCSMNQAAITINLILVLMVSALSVHPRILELGRPVGLGASSLVSVYCTYLTLSAVAMEPDDKQCNPLVRANGTRTASIVIGAIMTFVTIAYTTTRAASSFFTSAQGSAPITKADLEYQPVRLETSEAGDSSTPDECVTEQPSRRQLELQAIQEGVLPAYPTTGSYDDEDDDDPKARPLDTYDYVTFHLIFMLSTAWVATLLTMNVNPLEHEGDFVAVGRTYWASWVKIISSWVCYAIYSWTLVAPVVMPHRFELEQ